MAALRGDGRAPDLQRQLAWIGGAMVLSLVVVALGAPWVSPFDPVAPVADSFGNPFPPGWVHMLGTDELGRDVLSRLLYGARLSLFVAVCATLVTVLIGLAIGLAAGYFGGWVDTVLMRTTDVVLAFPLLLLALALAALLEPGMQSLLIVIAAVGWTGVARTVRGELLSLRERDFLTAAVALGASPARLMLCHLLPNVATTVLVMAVLSTSNTVLLDAGLSYLGLGIPVPTPSWGRMLSDSQTYYRTAPWLMVFPGLAIMYTVVAFNFLGYGLLGTLGRNRRTA